MGTGGLPHPDAPRNRSLNGVGVVAALEAEARTLGPAAPRRDGLSSLRGGALLAVGGMGGVRAAIAARRLVDAGAAALMSFGFAGGLDPSLSAGSVVLPGEVISIDGVRFSTSAGWCAELRLAILGRRPVIAGKLLTKRHISGPTPLPLNLHLEPPEPPSTRDWIRTTHNRVKRRLQSLSLRPGGEG